MMGSFIVFMLHSFLSYSADPIFYSRETDFNAQKQVESIFKIEEKQIDINEYLSYLNKQTETYVHSLMLVLLNEDTPQKNKIEIIEEIRTISEVNGKIERALEQFSKTNITQKKTHDELEKDEEISIWVKAQSELIRKKQTKIAKIIQSQTLLNREFYIDLAFNGALILIGGGLLFIPAGQAVSFALISSRLLTLTSKQLGTLLAGLGGIEIALKSNYFLDSKNQKVVTFFSTMVVSNPYIRSLMILLASSNESDQYLFSDLSVSTTKDDLIKTMIHSIKEEKYSIKGRQAIIQSLKAFPNMKESLKKELIKNLQDIIENSNNALSLRKFSLNTLGEIGKDPEVEKYLKALGNKANIDEGLRLIALIYLGSHKNHFQISINTISNQFGERDLKKHPLYIQKIEIPKSFIDSFQKVKIKDSEKQATSKEELKNQIIVLKKLISLPSLDIYSKLELSTLLIGFNEEKIENKIFLREVWWNFPKDIENYIDVLSQKISSEEDSKIFYFLKEEIKTSENKKEFIIDDKNNMLILNRIDATFKKLEILYPNSSVKIKTEIIKNIEKMTNLYKSLWND